MEPLAGAVPCASAGNALAGASKAQLVRRAVGWADCSRRGEPGETASSRHRRLENGGGHRGREQRGSAAHRRAESVAERSCACGSRWLRERRHAVATHGGRWHRNKAAVNDDNGAREQDRLAKKVKLSPKDCAGPGSRRRSAFVMHLGRLAQTSNSPQAQTCTAPAPPPAKAVHHQL